jgi:RNA polymerase sigma factor (sigma-70 family)
MDVVPSPALPVGGVRTNRSAIEEAARQDWARLVRFAYATVGDRQVAEELVQDAFLRVLRAGDRVENPHAFLRTTLVNVCKSFTLRRSREPKGKPPSDPLAPSEIDETVIALQRLRPVHRTVLALRYYEDLSIESIALELDLKPGTVKSLVHRALKDLCEQLEKVRAAVVAVGCNDPGNVVRDGVDQLLDGCAGSRWRHRHCRTPAWGDARSATSGDHVAECSEHASQQHRCP